MWGHRPPRSATNVVQNAVLRLRKSLGAEAIETDGDGYVLRVRPDAVDAFRFEELVGEGRQRARHPDPVAAAASFSAAALLWRARPPPPPGGGPRLATRPPPRGGGGGGAPAERARAGAAPGRPPK